MNWDKVPPNKTDGVIEGRNPVLEALKAQHPINKLLLSREIGRHSVIGQILYQARQNGIIVEYVDPRLIDRLSTSGRSQGVLAMVAAKDYVDLESLLEASEQRGDPHLYIVLDGIEDPQNLGAILRTVDATGTHGVIIPQRRAVGLTSAVTRASAGAVEYVPVARIGNLPQTISTLRKLGIYVVGIDITGEKDYTKADYNRPVALVVGAEGKGLSRLVKERCDLLVSIPMRGHVSSLNASVAAALVLYEAIRQRSNAP